MTRNIWEMLRHAAEVVFGGRSLSEMILRLSIALKTEHRSKTNVAVLVGGRQTSKESKFEEEMTVEHPYICASFPNACAPHVFISELRGRKENSGVQSSF